MFVLVNYGVSFEHSLVVTDLKNQITVAPG
jgi:hypothetical protein